MFVRTALLILLLLTPACARLPWNWPIGPAPSIATVPIATDISWLADDAQEGRGVGTAGLGRTATYIANAFERAGLEPGAPEGSFLQRFEMTVGVEVAEARIELEGTALRRGEDFEAFLGSADGEITAEFAFAGYGISDPDSAWDDYAGLDVEGRVVLVLDDRPAALPAGGGHGPRLGSVYKRVNAHKHGAAAILIAPSQADAKGLGGRVHDQTANPTARAGKLPSLGISRRAAEAILAGAGLDLAALQKEMEHSGAPASRALGKQGRIAVDVARHKGEVANVVGVLRGTARPDEAVVIGAHYDHLGTGAFDTLAPDRRGEVHNGADDNASGTAALLALARSFGSQPAPKRSLVFVAFTAEEVGLVGSAHYAKNPAIPLTDTVAMLNLDMVGRLRDDKITIFGVRSSPVWHTVLERAAAGLSFDVAYVEDDIGPSDHTSFAVRGVPAVIFFTGTHSDYHTPDDDSDKIVDDGVARVASLVGRTARSLADAGVRPPARAVSAALPDPTSSGRGYGAYLGTIPAFGGEPVSGVRLQGVRDGSPAAKARLRGGDILISFDGTPVSNLEEFAAVLFRARPGREVALGYERDGIPNTTRATLGQRR